MFGKKRPGARGGNRRAAQHGAGRNSTKSPPDVRSTAANKAATGKRVETQGRRGGAT